MTDNDERMKPPTRRRPAGGRVLGGAAKTASAPPPPAELTREQIAAEQAAEQTPSAALAETEAHPAAAAAPHERLTPTRTKSSATPSTSPAPPPPSAGSVVDDAPASHKQSAQVYTESSPAVQPVPAVARQQTQKATDGAPPPEAAPPVGPAQGAEVAVRQAVVPTANNVAFPVRAGAPGHQYEQHAGSDAAPGGTTPWTQGSGRPQDIPEAAVVLNQRIITRESLDSSVPAALKLKKRIKRFALDNELDHLPLGDIISVALDEWLTTRGF
ncbi:hypothetical protein [Streptomyces olivochromogenes]|uniref:Uncharacterized protein n=1 Tax=Streptomyces olivochromogenes TaxID=1963 RepID=A0A250VVP8_STROL|nr:hypothetical protein [Streptomyces olivochromogenes]KUN34297.1 hypothetical protein AQJ27_49415 [Streptomyces olivochromogenes]GAX58348.1 hypothetical protein SO3561_09921 [Streptomyces olivochromogenes]